MSISMSYGRGLVVGPLVALMAAAAGVAGERTASAAERGAVPRRHPRRRLEAPGRDEAGLAVLRPRRAELHLHEGRQEAARANWPALSPEPVYFRTHNLLTSGDGTPALKWGSTGVYSEDAEGRPRYNWTILDRIFDTYLRARRAALRPDRLHARGALDPSGALPAPLDAGRQGVDLHRLGLSAQGLREVGRAGLPVGQALASSDTAGPRSRRGTGRSGTSRTSSTGGARPRSSTSSTTTPSTP